MNTSPAMTELMPPLASRGRPVDCECAATEKRYSALMRATQDGNCAAYSALLHAILPLLQRLVRSRLGRPAPGRRQAKSDADDPGETHGLAAAGLRHPRTVLPDRAMLAAKVYCSTPAG